MNEYLVHALLFTLGTLFSGLGCYFVLIQKVSKLEGKLDILVKMNELSEKNKESIGEIKQVVHKNRKDINKCFRDIETHATSQHGGRI